MSAISLTIKALLAQSTVTAVTSTRIYPLPLPLGTDLPAIAIAMSSEVDEYALQGAAQYPQTTVQIHCVAEKARDAIELGEKVKVAMRDHLYNNGNSPPSNASFQKESTDFTDHANDLSTHRRVMTFSVRWR
jgi:hypothetical protein